jgi:hypothetical protein
MKVTAREALTELRREKRLREHVYPRMISSNKLVGDDADKFQARLIKAIQILEQVVAAEQIAQKEPSFL